MSALKQIENKPDIKKGYYQVLFNGASRLGITSDVELAAIIKSKHTTVNTWRNRADKALPFSDLTTGDGVFIKEFMDLLIALTSFYIAKDDSAKWLRIPNPNFKNMSPIEFMMSDRIGIIRVNDYFRNRMSI
jgi:uncharacterized protein (DUF2384 family)